MISPEYCQLLSRYNRWMNERMYAAASAMADDERRRDRGAFFGSIHRTLNHILWGDRMWIGRFTGDLYTGTHEREGPLPSANCAPSGGSEAASAASVGVQPYGADMFEDFEELARARELTDTRILDWAGKLSPEWLAGTLAYRASADGRQREVPAWIAAAHLFQHAVHHRGQVTTLLKQAGHDVGVTDLPYLPGVTRIVD